MSEKEYIERGAAISAICTGIPADSRQFDAIKRIPAADVEPVVRCGKCKHGVPFDRNSEMDSSCYLHCAIWRGEEVKNVWHKYKKYYKDYSVVDRDGFCDQGEAGEPCMDERSDEK